MVHMCIFTILKFRFSKLSVGWKGKKKPKKTKNFVCCTLYFRNHISYDLYLWYTCMYKRIIPPNIFFHLLSKFWFLGSLESVGVVIGQKMAENDKKFCLSHCMSQEPYIIWLWFLVYMCKMMISPANFLFFKILIFGVFRGVKGKKWPKITNFNRFCSISQEL